MLTLAAILQKCSSKDFPNCAYALHNVLYYRDPTKSNELISNNVLFYWEKSSHTANNDLKVLML